jgi:S-adenosylmethionine/arginine decarboxylase-like enzyme
MECESNGYNILIDIYNVDTYIIYNNEEILTLIQTAIQHSNSNIIKYLKHDHYPYRINGLYLLDEGHVSYYTFPVKNKILFDIFVINENKKDKIIEYLQTTFGKDNIEIKYIKR